jgi:chorismate mutase
VDVEGTADDSGLRRLRAEITSLDRELVDALARRVELVRVVQQHKQERGVPLLDPTREAEILDEAQRAAAGRISPDTVAELVRTVLALTKRELDADDAARPD